MTAAAPASGAARDRAKRRASRPRQRRLARSRAPPFALADVAVAAVAHPDDPVAGFDPGARRAGAWAGMLGRERPAVALRLRRRRERAVLHAVDAGERRRVAVPAVAHVPYSSSS